MEVRGVARELGLSDGMCYLTSAKTGENVEQIFHLMAECTAMLDETIELIEELGRIATNKQVDDDLNTVEDVMDYIIVDFVHAIGNTEKAMDIVRIAFRECGLSLKNMNKEKIPGFVDYLYRKEIECGISEEVAAANRKRRQNVLATLKSRV
ncbi:MAG: hypothetical protein QXD15_03745 [Thermoplasmata archaeon]